MRSRGDARKFKPIDVVQMFEGVGESQNVQKWEVGFRELARVDATEPHGDKERESSEGAAHLDAALVLGYGDVVLLLTFVVVGIDENLGQVFEIGDVTTLDEEEHDVFDALTGTGVLPIDQDGLAAVDLMIPKQVGKFEIAVKKRLRDSAKTLFGFAKVFESVIK